ncbi:MAG: hypothetical protein K0Q99_562, partial [Clostridia bacterium]|nr:hypothetical protein [Clostridia bacterium]
MKYKGLYTMVAITVLLVLAVGFGGYFFMNQELQSIAADSSKAADSLNAAVNSFRETYLQLSIITVALICIIILVSALVIAKIIIGSIAKLEISAGEISQGQLAIKAYSKGPTGVIGNNINKVVTNLKTILSEINKISEQNKNLADILSKSVEQTDRATSEIANA